ncbi:MAG: hypothetical protein KDK66_01385 [Deltaproteobacteria bacterium]|nr:hypothetical protein [Deltaproteobacteria bacterium]
MFNIPFFLSLFFYQLSIGVVMVLGLMPLKEVDREFYRISSGLSVLLTSLALGLEFLYHFSLPESFGVLAQDYAFFRQLSLAFLIAYNLMVFVLYIRMRLNRLAYAKLWVRLSALLGAFSLIFLGLTYRSQTLMGGMKGLFLSLDFISAALFLGVFMLAMVFGHWYLVKSMPKKLLKRMAEIVIVFLILRLIVVALGFWLHYAHGVASDYDFNKLFYFFEGHGLFFWQRVLVGLVVPAGLSYMIWHTAKLGANQSATGLLYVGVVFVIIGEMLGQYLFLITGIPI